MVVLHAARAALFPGRAIQRVQRRRWRIVLRPSHRQPHRSSIANADIFRRRIFIACAGRVCSNHYQACWRMKRGLSAFASLPGPSHLRFACQRDRQQTPLPTMDTRRYIDGGGPGDVVTVHYDMSVATISGDHNRTAFSFGPWLLGLRQQTILSTSTISPWITS